MERRKPVEIERGLTWVAAERHSSGVWLFWIEDLFFGVCPEPLVFGKVAGLLSIPSLLVVYSLLRQIYASRNPEMG
jgi:hypothetical protein